VTPEEERQLAVDLFNRAWTLMETAERTEEQDDELINTAHASAYHWTQVGTPANRARSEWQLSRAYTVLDRAEPALHHARRCLAYCEENPEAIASGYAPSKEAIILWTHYAALEFMKRDVRVNVISPGPTDTPMMPAFEDHSGKELVDTFTLVAGRRSTPEEQAYPMIFLNSDAASYVTGENLNTDGGMFGGILSGRINLEELFAGLFPS